MTNDLVPSSRASFATPIRHSDVLVSPFEELLGGRPEGFHRGGPLWPDWDEASPSRLWFAAGGAYAPRDTRPREEVPRHRVDGRHHYWIGPVVQHFGHQLRDFSTRIIGSLRADPAAVLVYAMRPNGPNPPAWFWQVNAWYGVPRARVLVIAEPTMFAHLNVVPQPEWAGPNPAGVPPDPDYLDALSEHATARLGPIVPTGAVVVSRGRMAWGQVLGDHLLDTWFRRAGVRVMHPELLPVEDQLRRYAGADSLVFVGGSAAHGTQLLGRNLGRAVVIPRQPELWDYRGVLAPRSREFHLIEAVERNYTVGGRLGGPRAKVLLDPGLLQRGLDDLGILPPEVGRPPRRFRATARGELVTGLMAAGLRRLVRGRSRR